MIQLTMASSIEKEPRLRLKTCSLSIIVLIFVIYAVAMHELVYRAEVGAKEVALDELSKLRALQDDIRSRQQSHDQRSRLRKQLAVGSAISIVNRRDDDDPSQAPPIIRVDLQQLQQEKKGLAVLQQTSESPKEPNDLSVPASLIQSFGDAEASRLWKRALEVRRGRSEGPREESEAWRQLRERLLQSGVSNSALPPEDVSLARPNDQNRDVYNFNTKVVPPGIFSSSATPPPGYPRAGEATNDDWRVACIEPKNLLIITPFKVGSTTLADMLAGQYGYEVAWDNSQVSLDKGGQATINPGQDGFDGPPQGVWLGRLESTARLLVRGHTHPPEGLLQCKGTYKFQAWITLVREPINIYPSAFFQDASSPGYPYYVGPEHEVQRSPPEWLKYKFFQQDWPSLTMTSIPYNLDMIKKLAGVDVWQLPFNITRGCQIYDADHSITPCLNKVVLLNMDLLNDPDSLKECLLDAGVLLPQQQRPSSNLAANTGLSKWYGWLYSNLRPSLIEGLRQIPAVLEMNQRVAQKFLDGYQRRVLPSSVPSAGFQHQWDSRATQYGASVYGR